MRAAYFSTGYPAIKGTDGRKEGRLKKTISASKPPIQGPSDVAELASPQTMQGGGSTMVRGAIQ